VFLVFFFFLLLRRLPCATPFPYTTLFRSYSGRTTVVMPSQRSRRYLGRVRLSFRVLSEFRSVFVRPRSADQGLSSLSDPVRTARSEEHTSELQSRENLVCRLLLEKKKDDR